VKERLSIGERTEEHPELIGPGYEIGKEIYFKKKKVKIAKKRHKKQKILWINIIQLSSNYRRRIFIVEKFIFDSRKKRYKREDELFDIYGSLLLEMENSLNLI
jgi:hypothetical protein